MKISENQLRDIIFDKYSDGFSDLIVGRKSLLNWSGEGVPSIKYYLQQIAENKINELLDGLETLSIKAKELRLDRLNDSTTRIDLYGDSEQNGITIIELKKSKQTERQAFTELLGYANHFCTIFPGTTEAAITSILVAPMENRVVRDAYVQELIGNNKNIIALIPKYENDKLTLEVYYPSESYYSWFQNNLLDDASMSAVAFSFPKIDGWIDLGSSKSNGQIPDYSKDALNTIANTISHRLEAESIHCLAYASQKWEEVGALFPYPNTIFIVAINPFSSYRSFVEGDLFSGDSDQGRLAEVQCLYNQLRDEDKEFWLDFLESNYRGLLIRIVKEEFERCFTVLGGKTQVQYEISCPDWFGVKTNLIDAVTAHNLDVFTTGILRNIYQKYLENIYRSGIDPLYFSDDIPKYSYDAQRNYLAIWEILRGIGLGEECG